MIWYPPVFHELLTYLDPTIPWISTIYSSRSGSYDSGSLFRRHSNRNFLYSPSLPGKQFTLSKYTQDIVTKELLNYVFTFPPNSFLVDDCRRYFLNTIIQKNQKNISDYCSLCAGAHHNRNGVNENKNSRAFPILKPYYGFANPLLATKAAIHIILPSLIQDGLFSVCWHTGFTHDIALGLYFLLHEVPTWSVFEACFRYKHGSQNDINTTMLPPFLATKKPQIMHDFIYKHASKENDHILTTNISNLALPTCFFRSHVAGYKLTFLHNTTWYRRTGGISRAKLLKKYPLHPFTIKDCALQFSLSSESLQPTIYSHHNHRRHYPQIHGKFRRRDNNVHR
uniref:Uncharacterized protein n=2 Tax=Aureoumbra lagunensis TaxID=44058 RepID=A0A7S3JZA9_9STRA|mmetsp:Transcript_10909/g.16426  ORF Transcript_10909/g.16426 Transcript_10909/m.16426 type:complete len:339 (-) Transcript_10909:348-1364(-)